MPCKKHGDEDLGNWMSSKGKTSTYCRICRRERARNYIARRENAEGSHTRNQWLNKLSEFSHCPKCGRKWSEIPSRPDKRYKNVWTKDHIIPLGAIVKT